MKILPKVFKKNVRISTILTLMAYNDYAYSLESGYDHAMEEVPDRIETAPEYLNPLSPLHEAPSQPIIHPDV